MHLVIHLDIFLDENAIASLADCSLAMALLSSDERNEGITAIEFKINFFVPVHGSELAAKEEIIPKRLGTAVGVANIISESGNLVAKVIGN